VDLNLSDAPYEFWMGGKHATKLVEISKDPAVLDDGNFWAISTTFEGVFTFARFDKVVDEEFTAPSWTPIESRWRSTLNRLEYIEYVKSAQQEISEGLIYQVNACRILSTGGVVQGLNSLFKELLRANPAPFASYLKLPTLEIASASPELFISRLGNRVKSSPIKGTQTLNEEGFSQKDQAENIMIVDLMRNDLGQVCSPGSIEVEHLLRSEDHPGIRHLVSDVVGDLKPGTSWAQILEALLPPGSVSGAPKHSALKSISKHEKGARGPYCGALGWIQGDSSVLSVAIRTFWKETDNVLRFGTGAGITWQSDANSEWEETELKAMKLLSIAGGELS
jgi:para-aminobenzoate synthetase component 1